MLRKKLAKSMPRKISPSILIVKLMRSLAVMRLAVGMDLLPSQGNQFDCRLLSRGAILFLLLGAKITDDLAVSGPFAGRD